MTGIVFKLCVLALAAAAYLFLRRRRRSPGHSESVRYLRDLAAKEDDPDARRFFLWMAGWAERTDRPGTREHELSEQVRRSVRAKGLPGLAERARREGFEDLAGEIEAEAGRARRELEERKEDS